jgi:hypothetical protein
MHRKGLLAAGVDLDLSVSTVARRLENPEVGGVRSTSRSDEPGISE